jgi:hypothetical protein
MAKGILKRSQESEERCLIALLLLKQNTVCPGWRWRLKQQVPLSISQRETIETLRNWLREGRAQSASLEEFREAEQQFVPLQLEVKP